MINWIRRFFCRHKDTKLTFVDSRTMTPKTRVCLDCGVEQTAYITWKNSGRKDRYHSW